MPDPESDNPWRVIEPYLSENGPSPRSEVPVKTFHHARERGIGIFHPHRLTGSHDASEGIVYLSTHSPEEVIRVWTETNLELLKNISRSTITRRINQKYGSEWTDAWKALAEEYGLESHQKAPDDADKDPLRQCPKCGDSIRARKFVKHVAECR